jgi:hypothetical protein
MNYIFRPTLFVLFCFGYGQSLWAQTKPINGYPPITAAKKGPLNLFSPDPIINYTWAHPTATDDLESYTLQPISWATSDPASFDMDNFKNMTNLPS